MEFIGQLFIMRQLDFMLRGLYENPQKGCSLLLRGPSGYGKTTLALKICKYLAGNQFEIYLADWTKFRFNKRVIFIDEVHRVKEFEKLYHLMDEKSHVFVFATNHDSNLPEAFRNRCYEFILEDYCDDDLLLIARDTAEFYANDDAFMEIIDAGNRNPRIIKSLCDRLNTYFQINSAIDSRTINYKELLSTIFSIQDGLDNLCRSYLRVLNEAGGTASILLLKSLLHVDESTLKESIEPILIRKGLIKITSKGRTLL